VIPFDQHYPYDIALSYASEDRGYADVLATILQREGVNLFYDKYEKATLWGQDLYTYLSDIYQNKARYCIIFISQHYATKLWTSHERKAAQARAFKEQQAYILPIRLDETEIPGILPTIAYLSWHQEKVESIAHYILEKLEDFSPKSKQQWFQECETYWEDGYTEKAIIASTKATNIDPYDWFGYYKTAWILEQLGRHEEALAVCEQGIQRDPTHCEDIIYFVKADALLGLKRYDEALAIYEQLLQNQHNPIPSYSLSGYLEALCGKGNILFELEQYEEAFTLYEEAIQLAPTQALGYENKGYSLYLLDRNEEALAVLEEAIRIVPKDAYSYNVKGDALYALKRFEEALAVYEQAIQLKPKDKYTYRRKGDTLKALKRPEEAQQAYEMGRQHDGNK
jgi:tetratricopeptide (TPR) repeat protein